MKKSRNKIGKSNEKYIIYCRKKLGIRYKVQVPKKQKKGYVGEFNNLNDAILCRDKFLSSL